MVERPSLNWMTLCAFQHSLILIAPSLQRVEAKKH